MKYSVTTNRPCSIKVSIQAQQACAVWIEAYDPKMANTVFTKRFFEFQQGQQQNLYIQLPIVGKSVIVSVYQMLPDGTMSDTGFTVTGIRKMALDKRMDLAKMRDASVRQFVRFAQQFCFNAGVLPTYTDRYYRSRSGDFLIRYVPVIIGDDGREELTPARINTETRVIEVSKARFIGLPIPQRMCILLHEYSHMYRNEDMYNELEADINGLIIYLGLGYPRIEAKQTFLSVFEGADGTANRTRYAHIENFIDKYEELNFEHL